MNTGYNHLEPAGVFRFFGELAAIPHGSGNRKGVADWCVAFAKARGLECYRDAADNVTIIKEATAGYEAAAPLILQGHLDMVCEKAPDCPKDMEKEGLELAVDGDRMYAVGTTLGGDDGIAVAMALAILDADDIPHPRLEAVFTSDEEIGMLGAVEMDVSHLKGRKFINLDSEDEGIFTVSCAGGNMTRCTLPVSRAAYSGTALQLTVSGLQGGHSGAEIHKGRGNSSMLCGRALRAAAKATDLRVISVCGGTKDNAIPVETTAQVVVADEAAARAALAALEQALQNEYRTSDPGVRLTVEPTTAAQTPLDQASSQRVLCLLTCLPDGVQAMSAEMPGLVQTSLNLGILTTEEQTVTASCCVRSSVESQKEQVKDRLRCLLEQLGGTAEYFGDYPGWEYLPDSPLRELLTAVYREQYGQEPKIEAIHAGVECGMFCGKLPGLDCVSIGPDLKEVHTPRESMSISSVQRVWRFLLEVLQRAK